MILRPADVEPASVYRLMIGAVVPRPIAFVSTISAAGAFNLAPFSFFTVASVNPPVVCFAPNFRDPMKDTLHNVQETREFVVNIVSEAIAEQMNLCSGEYPPDVDEFQVSGLTPIPSELVKPPRIQESHVNMECRLREVIEVSAQPMGGSLVLGEIVCLHVDDAVMSGDYVDPDKLRAIGRMGGNGYSRTRDRFEMIRPKV